MSESIEKTMTSIPANLKNLPKPIQKYYQTGINMDFYKLAKLQDTIKMGICVGPIPCVDVFTEEKNNVTYKSLFSWDFDSIDFGRADIWYDDKGNLYRKSGIIFKSFKKIGVDELKDYLKKQLIEDDFLGEAYKEDKNYQQIVFLEKQIVNKIDKL